MSLDEIKLGFDLLQTIATFGIGIWLYLEKKRDTTHARIDALEAASDKRLDEHTKQIATLEARPVPSHQQLQEHAARLSALEARTGPSHQDLGDLHEKVNEIAVSSGRMEGEIKVLSDTLRLILSRITERGMQ